MADNKLQYRISIGGQSQTWDADKYERNKDALMTKYPDAKVEEVHMSSKSDLEPSADRYLVTINGMSQEWDSDRMNRNREKLLQKYPDAQIERVTNTVPMFDDEPNAPMTAHLQSVANPIDNDTNEIKPLGGYWANVKEGAKELWAQGKYIVGEGINLLTGTNRDELAVINDIENLEERGIDPSEFIKKQEDSEFVSAYGMSKEEFMKLSKDKRTELIKKASSKNAKVIMPDEVDDVKQKAKHAENLRDLYWSALEEADGNLEKAKQILAKKAAEEESLGDKIIEGAIEDAKKIRPSEGFAGYLGRLTTQMIPNASAIALAALSKGKSAKASAWLMGGSKALGMAGMAGLTASAGGSAMMEAREKGASNEEVWASAFAAMGIEAITEWIPYDTYTKDIYSAIKKKIGKDIKKEVFENTASAGMKEFQKLIEEANKKLGGKLLNGKSIKDWFVQTLTEGVSEFFAEAGGTMVPMIYEEPEKYPTLSRIFLNGLEGMKAGLLMGAVLGGASQATSHSLNKDRRKQQGFVNVAQVDFGNGDVDVAELVGKNEENGKYIVLRGNETEEVDREQIIFNKHFTYNEFESARYKQLTDEAIDNGTVTDGQVVASADRVGAARKSLDKAMTDAGYTEEQKNAAFNALDNNAYPDAYENLDDKVAKAMDGYLEAKGRDKAVQDARVKREQNEKDSLRQEIEQQVGGRFWRESEDGDSVEVGTLKDGRVVYILSDVNENGEASAVTEKGEQIIINVDMLNDVTLRSSLDEFLSARVKEGKKQAEQARMSAEATPQLNEIRAKAQPGVQVNLGTADSPIVGTILQIKPEGDGVLIQTESGVEAYTYEQLGDIFGTPVRVLTDEQIAAAEAAEIESADAARSAEVAQDSEQMDEVEAEVDTAVKNEDVATETPLPTNPDGSVNEDALFAENPARWAEWNDAERNDGGENSRAYIQGKIDRANAKIAELQKAYDAEDSLNKKKALEKEIASQKEIVASLSEVMQRYAPKQEDILTPTAEVKAKIAAEKMEAIQKRVEKWEKRLGLKINILRSIDEVKDPSALETIAKGRTRAWFDPNTLEVYVYAPHIAVLRTEFIDKDVDEAIFHEVVGHKGIKQMLKPEEFDQLLDRVWSEVMTEADRIRYSRYAGVKGNTRRAADEYMAHISEGMQYDSIWNKIANWFKDLIGFEVNIETATVEQILRESYRNFGKNTGATTTPEGAKQDVMPSVIETLSEDLTMDEIREVTSNDLAIAQQTYDALVANAPVVEQGESSADYIARKRAYNEQLNAAMADLEAKRAIVDEVAMLETPEGAGNELSEEASVEILEANGMEVNEDTDDILFSHRYGLDEQMRDKVLDGIVKVTGRPREDAEKWLESEQSATALVLADKQYLDYVPDDRYKAIKDNSDYPQGTVDFNNICRKRVSFTKMFTRLQRRFPNRVFTADDLADIRTIMSNDGLVVACGLCYVEDRRQMVGEVAAFFIDQMQKDFIDYTYEVSAKDFVAGKMKKKKSQSKDKVKKAAKYKILIGNDTYVPKVYDLTTLEGLDKLYREHRGIWDAFQAFNSDRGQQSQNLFQGYAEYKREILSWSDAKVKKVNSLGGLRVFSYSDFEAHHLLDLIQIIIDCAARGVMIQGYTKVPEFARAVAMTGIKLNRSLIPLGDTGIVDGKLAYDPIEGIDVNDPNFFESNDNVGNILIGINDEQIRLAMADPFIHYIIPYHARQAEGIRMKLKVGKWENYIDTQNERNVRDGKRVKKGINIYTDVLDKSITNDREFVEKYLAVCKKKGYIPKFDQFLNRDAEGNYVYTPGYHKFLVDFKLFDENGNILPQRPVVAQFDDAFNAEVLQKYVAEEKETTGAQMNETYKKIVEALELNEEEAEGEDLMFSSEVDDLKTMTLGEINRRFNAELQQQIDGTLPEGHIYSLGLPSNKLLSAGLSNLPIEMPASRLVDKSMQENHPYKLSDVMNLPSAIQRPLAVFISATHIGSHVILTELNVKGRNFVAALRVMPTGKSIMINRIRSLYPKNTMAIVDWVTDNLGTTYDRTKMLDWLETKKSEMLSKPQSNSVDVRKRFASATKVVKEFVNPTLKIENLYSTRVDEDRAKLFDAAKVEFGVTNNFNVAGYMLPDGSLLDFSEAKDGGDPNDRTLDHRAVSRIIEDREYDSRYAYIVDFMNEGAIRIIPEHAGVQLSAAPTAEQRQKLLDYFYKENGYVILEVVGKDGGTIFNLEYDRRTSPYRIMRDIEGYFNEGIVPQQSEIMFSTSNRNQAIFVSNAAKAVEGIKMEKATPEQWLKMIEKSGGLKAGEDKWMGLSDWLKASDKKTLTKDEVMQFINDNMIVIEEQHYGEVDYRKFEEEIHRSAVNGLSLEELQAMVDEKKKEVGRYADDSLLDYMIEQFGDDFGLLYNVYDGRVHYIELDYYQLEELAKQQAEESGVRPIDDTRLIYTTKGLTNKHEIALTVPTIESWGDEDEIHFGDAGDGRSVAWIRFGDTFAYAETKEGKEYKDFVENMLHRYHIDEEVKLNRFGTIVTPEELLDALTDEQMSELQRLRAASMSASDKTEKRILVIDEIQSKRHQEGREKGYKSGYDTSNKLEDLNADLDKKVERRGELIRDKVANEENEKVEVERLYFALNEVENVRDYDRLLEEQQTIVARMQNREAEIQMLNSEIAEIESEIGREENYLDYKKSQAIEDAPFEKNWQELAMKRMLRYAAENGYDVVAWTKGEQQAERYDIGEEADGLSVHKSSVAGKYHIWDENAEDYREMNLSESELANYIGKEATKSFVESGDNELSLEGLRIGGEGMKGFYDKMLPAFMNKYGKKWGIKVEDINLPHLENGLTMHSVPVTEEMKQSVMEGQLMFSTESTNFASAITPEVRKEMDVISAQAIVNGNYLKAPNGKDTKLTPEQWALVRTKNFINWFGDWINDPEHASKVVDENGEPMVVYHGTAGTIETFEDQQRSPGFWFVDREDVANGYAESAAGEFGEEKNIIPVFLNIRNPRIEDAHEEYPVEFALKSYVENDNGVYEVFDTYEEAEAYREANVPDGWVGAAEVGDQHDLVERAKELGYDGVVMLNMHDQAAYAETRVEGAQTNYVVLDANQIKSATENNGEYSESEDIRFSTEAESQNEDYIQFSTVTDPALIEWLENEEYIVLYRAMQIVDGNLYPPMAGKTADEEGGDRKWGEPVPEKKWLQGDEMPWLAVHARYDEDSKDGKHKKGDLKYDADGNPVWVFLLDKGNGKTLYAAYNPYIHTSASPLNDQFSEAQDRDNLVVVRVLVPKSELTSGYKAEKAKDSVGMKPWHKGPISGVLAQYEGKGREVMLTRWAKIDGIVDFSEVADETIKLFEGTGLMDHPLPTNVFMPQLRQELEKRGLKFVKTTNKGEIAEGEHKGKTWAKVYGKNGLGKKPKAAKKSKPNQDILFSTRQPNQSAENFCKQCARDYIKKYSNLAFIDIMPITQETADKVGLTMEKLQNTAGKYLGKNKIAIFANEWLIDSAEVEGTIFHETVHMLIEKNGKLLNTGRFLWKNAKNVSLLADIKTAIEEEYSDSSEEFKHEEMLCRVMETVVNFDSVNDFLNNFRGEHYNNVKLILDKTKYGNQLGRTPESIRPSESESRVSEENGTNETTNGKGVEVQPSTEGSIPSGEQRGGDEDIRSEVGTGNTDSNISTNGLLFSTGREIDDLLEKGLPLSVEEYTNLAANIFKSMPEDMRKEVVENASRDNWDLKKATFQMVARLAEKSELNDEEVELAKLIAQKVDDAVRATDIQLPRPLTTNEALWALYQSTNRISDYDVLGAARKAAVADNLGFSPKAKAEREKLVEEIMFSTASDANNNATANLYNKGVVNYKTRLKESFVDMHASVEELVKAIEIASGKVAKGFENILLALNQQSSKGLAAMEEYERKFLEPMFNQIVKIMKEAKVSYDDVVRYVILKHGLERNDKMAKRDAKEFWTNVYGKVANMIKGQSHASLVVALSDAKAKVQEIEAKLATAKGSVKTKLQEQLDNAKLDVTIVELALRNDEKANEQELKDRLDAVEAGTDAKYKELRNQDYSGISSMFYDTLGVDRKQFDTEEAYQTALMRAKAHKYDTLADIEGAAQMEVDLFEKTANTKGLWKSINAATKEILRQQYMANMISKEQYESLRDMFQFYVPLRGFADNTAEDMYTYYRKPNSTGYTKPILGAEGRSTEAESPFGWIASMASSAIASNVKNEAKLALYYFVSNRPDNGVATISKTWYVDSGEVDARGRKVFKPAYPPFTEDLSSDQAKADYEAWQENMRQLRDKGMAYESGQRLNLGDSVVNINEKNRPEHVVNVKIGGKDYTIIINGNPRAAQAINGDLNIEAVAQDYQKVFGYVLRWMSSVNTSYNPEFWVTNTMRDMLFTWMSVNVSEDPEYKKKFGKNYKKAFKVLSLARKYEKGTLGNSQLENLYKEFVKNGGVTGYTQIKDNELWEKEIAKYMKSKNAEDKKTGIALRYIKRGLHAMHRVGESLEQVSRFAAFLTAKEMGMSTSESVNKAKEITVNFNRKGSGKVITLEETSKLTNDKGQPLNKLQQWFVCGLSSIAPFGRRAIMFFNASIQGLNAYYKLFKNNPKKMATWAAGYAIIGILNAVMHSLLDDDDDYMDMPDYERRTNLMLGGNGVYFKWALPQEARAFYALGDLAVESILGRNPHESIIGEALKIVLDIAPFNSTEGARAIIPSYVLPAIEVWVNEDYKGDPIYNEMKWLSDEEKKHTPKWENAYQGTGKPFILLSKLMNGVSDWGDTDKAGLFNVHPESIEHLVESAFGGTIRTAEKGFNTVWNMFDPDEEVTVRQTPFLNRILTINKERYTNVHTSEVFDYYLGYLDSVDTRLKKYRKENDVKNYNELMESDEVKWLMIYNNKYKKPLKRIKEEIKIAKNSSEKKEFLRLQDQLRKDFIKEISNL